MMRKPLKIRKLSLMVLSSAFLPMMTYAGDSIQQETAKSIQQELNKAIQSNSSSPQKDNKKKTAIDDIAKATDDELINMPTVLQSKVIERKGQRMRVIETEPEKTNENTIAIAKSFKPIDSKSISTAQDAVKKPVSVVPPKPKGMPKFNLTLNQAPANEALMSLVVGTTYSMLVSPNIEGTISLNLKQVNLFEALESIKDLYGYTIKVKGTRIFVDAPKLETKLFYVDYLNAIRNGSSNTSISASASSSGSSSSGSSSSSTTNSSSGSSNSSGSSSGGSGGTGSSTISTSTKQNDFWANVESSLKMMIANNMINGVKDPNSEGKNITINYQTGIVVVRATPDELSQIENFLKRVQNSVDRQVIIEAKIVEVQLSDEFRAGINWAMLKRNPNSNLTIVQTTSGGLNTETFAINSPSSNPLISNSTMVGITFQTSNFSTLLTFLDAQGQARVLSSPRIATVNNQKAVLKVGKDIEYVSEISSNQTTTTGGVITNATPSISRGRLFSGIALDVTPQVDNDKNVTLHLHPSISEVSLQNQTIGGTSVTLPTTQIRETDSVIRAEDGQIIAIGGLMQYKTESDEAGIPILKDIPVFGNLFKNRTRLSNKSELIILLKPTIIRTKQDWQTNLSTSQKTIEEINQQDKSLNEEIPIGNP